MNNLIQEVSWGKIRKNFFALDPGMTKIIDDVNPDDDHTFIKVICPFGSEILKNSQFQLPDSSGMLPFDDPKFDKRIRQKLAYCLGSNPMAFVLKNSVEMFMELEDRIIPFAIIPAGKIFGAWRFLDDNESYCPKTSIWGLTAGARSIFMLPKIAQSVGHGVLQNKFNINIDKPKSLLDHWKIFRVLSESQNFGEKWNVELLYFTDKWFSHKKDKAWASFYYHLLNNAWQGSGYWRNQFVWELVFSIIEKKYNIKPPAYLIKLVKHLLTVAAGVLPGFSPALDESLAPIKRLQEIYIDDYGMKEHAPIIMQPAYLSSNDKDSRSVYCSLQYQTAIEFSVKSKERTTALTDLRLLKSLSNKYAYEILGQQLQVHETLLYKAANEIVLEYFHSSTSNCKDIKKTSLIEIEDSSFTKCCNYKNNTLFPHKAKFLNGCVRLSRAR